MKKLAAIGVLGLVASCLYAQGLNTGGQTKDHWEEINFEFNSSILSDGYPSMLRLADLLSQHRDYHVKITGHTDYVGSAAYNDRLALRRAEAVKAFLVKYGASPDQITTAGDGKRDPEVDNRSKEGRFMNRRVEMAVTDGTGKLIRAGGIGDVVQTLLDMAKKQEECCAQILKRLDKLDDILAALKALQGDNDRLKGEVADLRNQQNALKDQVANLPKPLNEQQTQTIAHTEALGRRGRGAETQQEIYAARDEYRAYLRSRAHRRFHVLRQRSILLAVRRRRAHTRCRRRASSCTTPGRKEGQFDIGLGATGGERCRPAASPASSTWNSASFSRAAAWDRARSCWITFSTGAAWGRSSPAGSRTTPS